MAETNALQVIFAAMWKQAEGNPAARKILALAAEGYNRRMAEINGKN